MRPHHHGNARRSPEARRSDDFIGGWLATQPRWRRAALARAIGVDARSRPGAAGGSERLLRACAAAWGLSSDELRLLIPSAERCSERWASRLAAEAIRPRRAGDDAAGRRGA